MPTWTSATRGVMTGDIPQMRSEKTWSHQTQRCPNRFCRTPQDCRALLTGLKGFSLGRTQLVLVCLCVFMITHIMCDFAQSPDRVYSLNCVIWYNYRWLTAGEHYLHGGVRHILHTGAFKQAWKKEYAQIQEKYEVSSQDLILRGSVSHTCRFTHNWSDLI